ncbi:MAG: response regulator [Myxococcota bacterium]|nr:response regulator [Myxococcota bacterium]
MSLAGHIASLEDPAHALDPDAALDANEYVVSERHQQSFGITDAQHWFRFTLENPSSRPVERILDVQYHQLDEVDLYEQGADGAWSRQRAGDTIPWREWPVAHHTAAFHLDVPPGAHVYLLRVASTSSVQVPVSISGVPEFRARAAGESAMHFALYGLLVGLALFHALLYAWLRDRSYLYYVLYLAGATLFLATYNGTAFRYLWPDATRWNSQAVLVLGAACFTSKLLFMRSFLELRARAQRLDRVVRWALPIAGAGMLAPLVPYSSAIAAGGLATGLAVSSLIVTVALSQSISGHRPARFFLLACGTAALGVLASLLHAAGWLPPATLTARAFQLGVAGEAVLLALALADRIELLRRALEEVNERLEARVIERTRSLEAKNAQLRRESEERQRAEEQRAQLEQALQHSQRLEALGRLGGGVAHDMNNVLGSIVGYASLLRDELPSSDKRRDDVEAILEAALRGRDLTANLLGFARKGTMVRKPFCAHRVIETVVALARRARRDDVPIEAALRATRSTVEGDPNQLTHAMMNLCLNALDAIEGAGHVTLATDDTTIGGAPAIRVRVIDDGCGMDEETQRRAFEPFFTRRRSGDGTGLGLSMVYGCIESHGGEISIESERGRGTTIAIVLRASAAVHAPTAPPPAPRRGHGRVLIVDDDATLARATQRQLRRLGYDTEIVSGGAEGVERVRASAEGYDLVVLDMTMPGMDGRATFVAMREIAPTLPVLIVSGYTDDDVMDLLRSGARGFLPKPFDPGALSRAVASALGAPAERDGESPHA